MGLFRLALLALLAASPTPATAEERNAYVSVVGEAATPFAPDFAIVVLEVKADANSVAEASATQAERLTATLAALKSFGAEPEDVTTLGPRVESFGKTEVKPQGDGSRVVSLVNVRLRKLERLNTLYGVAEAQGPTVIACR